MNNIWILSGIVLAMLGIERLVITAAIKHPLGRRLIRRIPILHPNGISLLRIPMGVVSIGLAARGQWPAAILWFAFWMITDLTDGTIARHCDLATETGKWLDPLSDKCMYFPALIYFAFGSNVTTRLEPATVIAFLLIDTLGQMSRLVSRKKAANLFGKTKTALVTILLSAIALNQIDPNWIITPQFVHVFSLACVILAFLSCYCKVIPDIWYANSFTLANFLCGLGAIWYAFQDNCILSFVLVFLGQFFDLFDGRMARKYGSTKRGAFFDDIADATSFGVAIGCLIFFSLAKPETAIPRGAALAIAVFYVACLIYRLYRFLHPTRTMPKGVFQGLPSPAGALLAGSSVLLSRQFSSPTFGLIAAAVVIITSILMVSNIPYRHFGQSIWPGMPKTIKLLLFILLIMFTVFAITHRNYRFPFIGWTFGISILYLAFGTYRKRHHPNPGQNEATPEDAEEDAEGDDQEDDDDQDDRQDDR